MENGQIVIPEGWTYFAHRSNTERWNEDPFAMSTIVTNKLTSVVTERDIYDELNSYGRSHVRGYSTGNGTPFEIRCLICGLPYLRTLTDESSIKTMMMKEFYYDRNNFGGVYGQRHHSIPKGEELVVLGIGDYDEVFKRETKIIWVIPKRFIDFYKMCVGSKNDRFIPLSGEQYESGRSK